MKYLGAIVSFYLHFVNQNPCNFVLSLSYVPNFSLSLSFFFHIQNIIPANITNLKIKHQYEDQTSIGRSNINRKRTGSGWVRRRRVVGLDDGGGWEPWDFTVGWLCSTTAVADRQWWCRQRRRRWYRDVRIIEWCYFLLNGVIFYWMVLFFTEWCYSFLNGVILFLNGVFFFFWMVLYLFTEWCYILVLNGVYFIYCWMVFFLCWMVLYFVLNDVIFVWMVFFCAEWCYICAEWCYIFWIYYF